MLNLRSLIERVVTECPLIPDPETVRKIANAGRPVLRLFDVFDRVEVKGRDFLLGGGHSRRPKRVKIQVVRSRRKW
jgi:hypothetical protein